jgi:uncharacterized membrane protein YozB (DUF420 family)
MMGGVNDGPWACCTINSTVKNAAEVVQTSNLPIADETIPYAFVIVIVTSTLTLLILIATNQCQKHKCNKRAYLQTFHIEILFRILYTTTTSHQG